MAEQENQTKLNNDQILTLREILTSISAGDHGGLCRIKNIRLYKNRFEWEILNSYGIVFGSPPIDFDKHIVLIKFKNRAGYAFECPLWKADGKITDVRINFELHDEFDPTKIYVGWPSLI